MICGWMNGFFPTLHIVWRTICFWSRYISINDLNQIVMRNFIEDYLHSPSQAIAAASDALKGMKRFDLVDEDIICQELDTPEFRLYEEIIFSSYSEDFRLTDSVRPVA